VSVKAAWQRNIQYRGEDSVLSMRDQQPFTLNVFVATCTVQGTPAPISTALCYRVSTARLNCMDEHDNTMLITYYYSYKIKHKKLQIEFWLGIMKVQGQLRNVKVA